MPYQPRPATPWRAWTPDEDAVLRSNPDLGPATLAAMLGRAPKGVANRRVRLKVADIRSQPLRPHSLRRAAPVAAFTANRDETEACRKLARRMIETGAHWLTPAQVPGALAYIQRASG